MACCCLPRIPACWLRQRHAAHGIFTGQYAMARCAQSSSHRYTHLFTAEGAETGDNRIQLRIQLAGGCTKLYSTNVQYTLVQCIYVFFGKG
jgi:predicted ferric reductase